MSDELPQLKKMLEEHEERIAKLEKLFQTKPKSIQKGISIREFLSQKKPKSEWQKTLAMGYYTEKYGDLTSFSARDLENAFRRAKEAVPKNINLQVIANIQKGYMMEAKEKKEKKKAWYLTNSGEEYVESDFEQKK